ncbi:hypothetical protein evm_008803 [Chilo suppressalis]|nr:hypothetical protein evm_008803 [Chilo suppressalis]
MCVECKTKSTESDELNLKAPEIKQQKQNGTQKSRRTADFLNEHFPAWIGSYGQIRRPARSPDLTPLDFFVGLCNRCSIQEPPINVPTAGAQAFPMDGIGRLGHDPPRGPSADWWVLTTADAAGTNGVTCLPKHGEAPDSNFWSPIQ